MDNPRNRTIEDLAEEARAEARAMRDAAFLAYGALVALVGKAREARVGHTPMVNTAGAEDLIARLESVLFPEEPGPEAERERVVGFHSGGDFTISEEAKPE